VVPPAETGKKAMESLSPLLEPQEPVSERSELTGACIIKYRGKEVGSNVSASREQRSEKIEELKKLFQDAQGGVLTDFRGLSVGKITDLRRKFREKGVSYLVVKNTLTKIAVRGTVLEGLARFLEEPTGVAIASEDPIAPARVATEFAKDNEIFKIKGGFLEGSILSKEEVEGVSKLPNRQGLQSQILAVFNAPIQQLLGVFNAVPQKFLGVLKAQEEKLSPGAQTN
jgi:large subunit ribosomal protein L10